MPPGFFIPDHGRSDDPHYFLGVIAAMSQAQQGGRYQLQPAEPVVRPVRIGPTANIDNEYGNKKAYDHTDQRSQENEQESRDHLTIIDNSYPMPAQSPRMR